MAVLSTIGAGISAAVAGTSLTTAVSVGSTIAGVGGALYKSAKTSSAAKKTSGIEISNALRQAQYDIWAIENDANTAAYEANIAEYNTFIEGENAIAAALARAEADDFNASLLDREATQRVRQGITESRSFEDTAARALSEHRANQAASGFTTQGSALLIDDAAVADIEEGMENIGINASLGEQASRSSAKVLRVSAETELENAKAIRKSTEINRQAIRDSNDLSQRAAELRLKSIAEQTGLTISASKSVANAKTSAARGEAFASALGSVGSFANSRAGSAVLKDITIGSAFKSGASLIRKTAIKGFG